MREAAGDDVDLCIEIHRRLTPAEAIVFAQGIEEFHPMFIEDPMRYEDADAMARIADRIRIPIATGERFSTIYEFQALFSRNAVEYARVDVALCGGITGSKKVAAMAEAHNVMVVPHNPLSPVGLAACLQIDASIPNFAIQEYTTGFEAGVMKSVEKHLGHDIVDEVPVPVDGFVDIPDRPGIGIDLVDDPAKVRPPFSKPIAMRLHKDGFPVDQ
jgi:galactonate dehydratase